MFTRSRVLLACLLGTAMPALAQQPITLSNGQAVIVVGKDGVAGKNGVNGKDGAPGVAGKDGAPGKDGAQGLPGRDGAPGANGKDGLSPTLTLGTTSVGPLTISLTGTFPNYVLNFAWTGSTTAPVPTPSPTPAPTPVTTAPVIPTSSGTIWYVRTDGGTRYSAAMPQGQCDGKGDAAYPGTGVNQHCAFSRAQFLVQDGSRTGYFAWVGGPGDTYVLRGSIADGVTYRVGWNNQWSSNDTGGESQLWMGLDGDPYHSGLPAPPAGVDADHPTRLLGGNFASCTDSKAKTQLHGGFGVDAILSLAGAKNVAVQCLDLTDFSQCSKTRDCSRNTPLSDYATTGIELSNTSQNVLLQDVQIHGTAANGLLGPTGDGVVMRRIALKGNASSGWNADNGSVGSGTLLVQNFDISWNGCSEEYPIVHALPYRDCQDDNSGGYGDGFGTASLVSTTPWKITFDQGVVSYNTQDGLDALHLQGAGSSITVNRTLAFGNMGQQIKVGGASGTATNNIIQTSCSAMSQPIAGTPEGYNAGLTDFCRAANTGVVMTVGPGALTTFESNTIFSNSSVTLEIECDTTNGPCDSTAQIRDRNNLVIQYQNGGGEYPSPVYVGSPVNPYANPGSVFDHNLTYRPKGNYAVPNVGFGGNNQPGFETNALSVDPLLLDEAWADFSAANSAPQPGSPAVGAGTPGVSVDFNGNPRPSVPSIGAVEPAR